MQALKVVVSILMMVALVGASYLALSDLLNPFVPQKAGSIILWLIFFVPTVVMVHFTWFHRSK